MDISTIVMLSLKITGNVLQLSPSALVSGSRWRSW